MSKEKEQNRAALPKRVVYQLKALNSLICEHIELLNEVFQAANGAVYPVDLVVMAVSQRSIALIQGFEVLMQGRNVLCTVPLLRLQIDSLMRLYACWLVDDPREVVYALFKSSPLSKIKSSEGRLMTDKYLYNKLTKHYPWVSTVYNSTSGFIHLSSPHMISPIESLHETGTASISIGPSGGREWEEEEMLELVLAFKRTTKALLHLIFSWGETKRGATPSDPLIGEKP